MPKSPKNESLSRPYRATLLRAQPAYASATRPEVSGGASSAALKRSNRLKLLKNGQF